MVVTDGLAFIRYVGICFAITWVPSRFYLNKQTLYMYIPNGNWQQASIYAKFQKKITELWLKISTHPATRKYFSIIGHYCSNPPTRSDPSPPHKRHLVLTWHADEQTFWLLVIWDAITLMWRCWDGYPSGLFFAMDSICVEYIDAFRFDVIY